MHQLLWNEPQPPETLKNSPGLFRDWFLCICKSEKLTVRQGGSYYLHYILHMNIPYICVEGVTRCTTQHGVWRKTWGHACSIICIYACTYRIIFRGPCPWLRRLVAGPSPRRPRFNLRPVHMKFIVDTLAMRQVFLGIFRLSPANIIPQMLHICSRIHSFFYNRLT